MKAEMETDSASPVVARIGRAANPAERTLQLVNENPEVLERMGKNLFGSKHGIFGKELTRRWNRLTDRLRARWMDDAHDIVTENVRTYVEPDGNDADPTSQPRPQVPQLRRAR